MDKTTQQSKSVSIRGYDVTVKKEDKNAHLCAMLVLEWLAMQQAAAAYIQLGRNFRVKDTDGKLVFSFTDSSLAWDCYTYIRNNIYF